MYPLNLPQYEIKITMRQNKRMIFDDLRRKYVALTPEEWVRQHFTHWLTGHLGYPQSLLANEVEITVGDKRLRCDTLLYNSDGRTPLMIVEYKAPSIAITEKVFRQASTYNMLLRVPWIVMSNGLTHYCCHIDYETGTATFVEDFPTYEEIKTK